MTVQRPPQPTQRRFGETAEAVIDADYVTLEAGQSHVRKEPGTKTPAPTDLRTIEPRGARPGPESGQTLFRAALAEQDGPKTAAKRPDDRVAFYGFGAALVALSFWVSGGYALFSRPSVEPDRAITTASIERGTMDIQNTHWRVERHGARTMLVVEGVLHNSGTGLAVARPVAVTVNLAQGGKLVFAIGTGRVELAPGARLAVSGQMDLTAFEPAGADSRPQGRLDSGQSGVASVAITLSDPRMP